MFRRFVTGLASVFIVASLLRQQKHIEFTSLEPFDVQPGPWFQAYLADWMIAHDLSDPDLATSGLARGMTSGDYIWVTETPEWDRGWFNAHGWEFPAKWVPFQYLAMAEGEPGGPCYLRGL